MADINEAVAKIQQLKTEYTNLIATAEAKANALVGQEATAEASNEVNALLGQADVKLAQIETLRKIEEAKTRGNEIQPSVAATTWRQAGPNEGQADFDAKAWREIKVETEFGTKTIRYNVPLAVAHDGSDKQERNYKSAFEFYMRKSMHDPMGPQDAKVLSEGVDSSGGFFIPEDYHAEILKKTMGLTAIRPNARVVPTSRDMVRWPRINYTTDNIYTSPVRLTWTGEIPASASQHRVNEAVAGIYQIPVNTAMASVPITNDLIEDSAFDLQGIYTDLLSEAFALGEDNVFLNGTGGSQPLGIFANLDVAGSGMTSVTSKNSDHTLAGDDILKMYYGVPAQYRKNAKWFMNSTTMQDIELLQDQQLRYLISSLLNSSLQTPQFDNLKGKQVSIDEFMPGHAATGNTPMIFGDMQGYLIVDRVGLSVQKIDQLYAELNQTLLLARRRLGGQLVEPYKLRALKMQ
jgi:HK97 family phage major capsid protein